MDGESHARFIEGPGAADGEYDIGMPNMYARGILFGKMVLELGDTAVVKNDVTGMHCDVDFKTKVRFSYPPLPSCLSLDSLPSYLLGVLLRYLQRDRR
jgi:hypothetical protein